MGGIDLTVVALVGLSDPAPHSLPASASPSEAVRHAQRPPEVNVQPHRPAKEGDLGEDVSPSELASREKAQDVGGH